MTNNRPSLADEINARVDCEDLAIKLGLVRPGDRGNFKSPHHADKMPSLSCYRKDGRSYFKDFSTDEGGGPVDLYMHVQGCDFITAVKAVGEMYRISVERPGQPGQPAERREKTRAEWIADNCLANVRDAQGLAQAIDAAAPAIPLYGRVKAALAQYRALYEATPAWPALPPVARAAIHAGEPYAGAALLQTAFISWRLRRTEGSYADRLAQIEGDGSEGPAHPRSGPLGAKTSVTAALALAGVAAAAAGLAGLT